LKVGLVKLCQPPLALILVRGRIGDDRDGLLARRLVPARIGRRLGDHRAVRWVEAPEGSVAANVTLVAPSEQRATGD
jgi:hypothetical protein